MPCRDRVLFAIDGNWHATILPVRAESPRRIALATGERYEVKRNGELVTITAGHLTGVLASAVMIASVEESLAVALKAQVEELHPFMGSGADTKLKRLCSPGVTTAKSFLTQALRDLSDNADRWAVSRERTAALAAQEAATWRSRESVATQIAAAIMG